MEDVSKLARVVMAAVAAIAATCTLAGCARPAKTMLRPAPSTLTWASYRTHGLTVVFDRRYKVVGFLQAVSATAGTRTPTVYTTRLAGSRAKHEVRRGTSPVDVKRWLGSPSAEGAGGNLTILEYGTVRNDLLLLDHGFRSFEFCGGRLQQVAEFYTEFELPGGVRRGMTVDQVIAVHGIPDTKGVATSLRISALHGATPFP